MGSPVFAPSPSLPTVLARSGSGILGFLTDDIDWPTCPASQASFQPLSNNRGQDPCAIALDLLRPCDPNLEKSPLWFDVGAFQNSPCACNTVLYSLFDICSECAGRSDFEATTWNIFRATLGCISPVNQAYIEPIPSDTAIPAWAYLPLGTDGKVNLTQAKETAAQNEPDITSPGSYIPPLPSRLGPSPMLGPVPTSDSTGPRSGSSTIAAPVASVAGSPQATVPESVSPSTNDLHLSAAPTPITPPLVTSVNEPGSGSASIQETTSLSRTFSSFLYGPSSLSPAPTMTSDNPPSLTPQSTPQETIAKSSRNLAPIFGGVLGGIAAAVLTAFLVLRLVRRRRHRRQEKEAVFASGSLDWWRRPDEHLHKAGREFTECSTMKAETDLDVDDLETLHATSITVENFKKSVTYGEYPDL